MLAPVDIFVLLKLAVKGDKPWVQQDLANELHVSQATVHRALKRAQAVRLYSSPRRTLNAPNLIDAVVCGARYFLAPTRGGEARGMPTSWAAPPLRSLLAASDEIVPVWPDPSGTVRGIALEPLHRSVPVAAREDPMLYELLALVDVLREGRARECKLAEKELRLRLCQQ
jgi:hypothetical protein